MLGSCWQGHHRKAKGVYSLLSLGSKSHHPWMEGVRMEREGRGGEEDRRERKGGGV